MLRRVRQLFVRRKHGQRAWSPSASSSGAAPSTGITAQEALQIAYRPMPLAQTVEYEEDFGSNMMIHREFISKKNRSQLSFDISALAYSDVELRKGRQQLANNMNRERRGVLVGSAGEEADRVEFHADVNDDTRVVRSARYLFNEARMLYCDRFQNYFRSLFERSASRGDVPGAGEDNHFLFSLMEACAIIYGCTTPDAQEVYYRMFLQLDLDSLEEQEEAMRSRAADAEQVKEELTRLSRGEAENSAANKSSGSSADVEALIRSVPPLSLFGNNVDDTTATVDTPPPTAEPARADSKADAQNLPEHFSDYAPLYKAYLMHAKGESPMASYDLSSIGASTVVAEQRRWRALMDKLVREDYAHLSTEEIRDASTLNDQLHTVKFFDLKVGDTVRDIMQLLQRETGEMSSEHRDTPDKISASHPERRV